MSKEEMVKSKKGGYLNFTDLVAWQESHRLYVDIYRVTKSFPKDELFGLTSQIRRAALSVTSNLAEGFGRSSALDKVHFYTMSRGSLYEVQNQLIAARDTYLLAEPDFTALLEQSQLAKRLIIGLLKTTRARAA
jgi:four helix bundle protein